MTRTVDVSQLSPFARGCAIVLSVTATLTSCGISVVAGWERGGQMTERLAWIFVGVVLLLSAHLIPALSRTLSASLRAASLLIWLCSMIATGYGHVTFFVVAQEHAGAARASLIRDQSPADAASASPGRDPAQIAIDRAQVQRDVAWANAQKCHENCTYLTARRSSLSARLSALNIEFDEAKRRERESDLAAADRERLIQRRDSAMADPVTSMVAHLLHVTTATVDLTVALSFGWLLESVACLGWLLALPRYPASAREVDHAESRDGPQSESPVVTAGNDVVAESNAQVATVPEDYNNRTELDSAAVVTELRFSHARSIDHLDVEGRMDIGPRASDLDRLAAAIGAGQIRHTVADIRRFLGCSQARALSLRRTYVESKSGQRAPQKPRWMASNGIAATGVE